MTGPGKRRAMLWASALLLTVTLGLLVIAGLINSEVASRKLLQSAADALGIDSARISGTLAAGIRLEDLRFNNETLEIRIDRLDFDWEPWALLYGACRFRSLRLDGLRIKYTAPQAPVATSKKPKPRDFAPPLRIVFDAADVYDFRLDYRQRSFTLQHLHLDGAIGSRLELNRLTLEAPDYRLSAQGSVDSRFPHAGELALDWSYHHRSVEFAGTARISGDIKLLELEHRLIAPGTLHTTGSMVPGIDGAGPHLEVHNRWSGLQPPFMSFPVDTDGELHASGWLDGYRLHGQGELRSGTLPPTRFSLEAGGDRSGLEAIALDLEALDGRITAQGSLRWMPALEWRAGLNATGIDLRTFHRQLPESLQLDFRAEGALTAGRWRGRFEHIRGAGYLRGHPLSLRGDFAFDDASLRSSALRLRIAENSLTLSGSLDPRRIDLRWQYRAPRLSALWPDLSGALNGGGRITGKRDSPRFEATLTAVQLAYADYRIARLDAGLRPETAGQHALTLSAERILLHGRTVSAFTLNASGNAAAHVIESRIQDNALAAAVTVTGGYKNSGWQGQLRRADWHPIDLPAWALQQPAGLAFTAGGIRIGHACWSAAAARICAELAIEDGNINAEARLNAVPAELLDAWWSPRLVMRGGLIDGAFSLDGTVENPAGRLELQADAGQIGLRREGAPLDNYRWESVFVRAELRNRRLSAATGITFPGYGNAQGVLASNLQNRSVDGDISAHFHNLAPLETVTSYLDDLSGDLQATMKFAGTMDRPELAGSLRLRNAAARIPRLGIHVRNLEFTAHGRPGGNIVFQGLAESGGGSLELDGTFAYGAAPSLQASVEGEDFEILRLPDIRASVNPSLNIKAEPASLSLRGTVLVPFADINIRTPPESAVTVSKDVIIVNAPPTAAQGSGAFEFTCQLRLVLGDDVRFQGFGFNAGLAGQLTLNKTPERPVTANGELTVNEGQYKAFGQQLEIQRGRLLFQGPYDNPGLDILALRRTPEVTVSLEIAGTLENPGSRVSSEPPLPESEAMAILLTGKPLDSASKSDANALVNAITGLGLRKARLITDDIARAFNLDEFKIKSESDVSESSLFIGKRISPRLFIRYIVGLFDQTSRIGLTYELSKHLRLEAESGWNQSMDLIYEIER